MRRGDRAAYWRRAVLYGAPLALLVLGLEWLDYRRFVQLHVGAVYEALAGTALLGLGVLVGARLFGARRAPPPAGNPRAQAALGVSDREREVLGELARGATNKEIARRLGVSPNTVKTHVSRLYAKLDAKRRTDAVRRARELDLLP